MNQPAQRSVVLLRVASACVLALIVGRAAAPPVQAETPAAPPNPAAAAKPAPAPTPGYAVVQGVHPESMDVFQSLTILCPDKLKVFGAGFSAVVRLPGQDKNGKPLYREEGLNDVRSTPDSQGAGWLIEGVSPGAAASKQPWRLAGRVVCVRLDG